MIMFGANNKTLSAIPALERGLDVLERINAVDTPLTLTAIARLCGRSISELQRVVACLLQRGYLFRDANGAYRISSKLFRMGQACTLFQDLVARTRISMRTFAQRTGEAVHLSVLTEDRVLILANVPGPGYLQLGVTVGSLHVPTISASGRVLLAGMTAADLAAYVRRNAMQSLQVKSLETQLARIRRRGYEYVASHLYRGVYDLTLAVTAPDGECVAALACSFLRSHQNCAGDRTRTVPLLLGELRHCARQITATYQTGRADKKKELLL
ncbi:MAG: IclR family transcriptional regulator [Phycisphaerae bacterium]